MILIVKSFEYFYSKFIKKVMRGKCVLNSLVDRTVVINSGCNVVNSEIGRYSYMGYDCVINYASIGKYCSIANDVIIGGAEHPIKWLSTSPVFQNVEHSGPRKRFAHHNLPEEDLTIIENDVWIGNRAIIKQGVNIHNGAVIGAGAVVTRDVPPYAIVGGVPAKIINYRFDEKTIVELIETAWWNLPENEVEDIAKDVVDVHVFLSRFKNKMRGGG